MKEEGFTSEEITIINSIIDIRNVSVKSIMVPLNRAYKLNEEEVINEELLNKIYDKNFSRIAIFSQDNKCKGFLKTKRLIKIYKNIGQKVKSLGVHSKPIFVAQNMNLLEAITHMKEKEVSTLVVTKE